MNSVAVDSASSQEGIGKICICCQLVSRLPQGQITATGSSSVGYTRTMYQRLMCSSGSNRLSNTAVIYAFLLVRNHSRTCERLRRAFVFPLPARYVIADRELTKKDLRTTSSFRERLGKTLGQWKEKIQPLLNELNQPISAHMRGETAGWEGIEDYALITMTTGIVGFNKDNTPIIRKNMIDAAMQEAFWTDLALQHRVVNLLKAEFGPERAEIAEQRVNIVPVPLFDGRVPLFTGRVPLFSKSTSRFETNFWF